MKLPSNSAAAPLDTVGHPRRQVAVNRLSIHREMTLADLAELVVESETGVSIAHLTAECVRDVYFDLYHRHVPKLEAIGLVVYDQETDLIAINARGTGQDAIDI